MIATNNETTAFDYFLHRVKHSSAVYQTRNGTLLLEGKDARDFLQRMSTNDLVNLQVGQTASTVLVNEKARIVDVVTVINKGSGLLLVTSRGATNIVQEWLRRFIILEDIRVTDLSHEYETLLLAGENVHLEMQQIELPLPHLPPDRSFLELQMTNGKAIVANDSRWQYPACLLIAPRDEIRRLWDLAQHSSDGAGSSFVCLTDELYHELRIEQGIPEYGLELTEDVNPLEARLDQSISFTKGCYIGQEVIARLDTYKKLRRKLTGLIFQQAAAVPVSSGMLLLDNAEVGWTTSHSFSQHLNRPIALGYLDTDVAETALTFKTSVSEAAQSVQVSKLPFRCE